MSLRLVSFKLCPFVQRSVVILREKEVPFDVTYIDLAAKPEWFLAISPRGKVPVLVVDDVPLFESAVINEYLDETRAPRLHPEDPLRRAHNRAWTVIADDLTMHQYRYAMAADARSHGESLGAFREVAARLEAELGPGPYFNGERFALVDAAFAPVFTRTELHRRHYGLDALAGLPKVRAYAEALLERESVRRSVPEDFEALYCARMERERPYLYSSAA